MLTCQKLFPRQHEQPKANGFALTNKHGADVSEETQQCKVPQSMSQYCELSYYLMIST